MIEKVYKLARFRPPRCFRTEVLYIYGESGTGKTTSIWNVLKYLQDNNYLTYYAKMGGLDKYFDGYDNQDIVWIDDPISNQDRPNNENVQRFKNIMSTGDTLVEVKFGSMVFDSKMIIVTSNLHPQKMAQTMGLENITPMYRRFTDSCGAYEIKTKRDAREKLRFKLLQYIDTIFDLNDDLLTIYNMLPVVRNITYSHIKW